MKNLSFLMLAGGLLACSTINPGATTAKRNAAPVPPTELVYKQPTTIALTPGHTVQATLTEVSDSRCPADVQCITAGYVAVGVSLSEGQAPPVSLRLCLGCNARNQPGTIDSVAVTLNQKPYWARLLALRPAPASPSNTPAPVATLRLRAQ
ncbi:hypothetical protein QMK33_01390 [Hymenobacter sp. H14-R3]|uniref:hypothetical protein n=1 Tax=Hymenobacter sp. H14-R3 TaxID=3046308 RepID=UPI0024B901BF|nr:hypothetical protein [Hymenobacter sp. H14-R3]MDJ0363788.1 hypothetical protein [Hymenobacter sp. H14-R3]